MVEAELQTEGQLQEFVERCSTAKAPATALQPLELPAVC